MTTNLLNLPQIVAGTTITIDSNVDWNDMFYVPVPGFPVGNVTVTPNNGIGAALTELGMPLQVTGTLSSSSATVTAVSSISGLVPGMVAVGYGIPVGTAIAAVGSNTITLSAMPTINMTGALIYAYPPPLDLTGISFTSILRPSVVSATALLNASTANGLMVNGTTSGTFGWQVPAASLPVWPASLASAGTLPCFVDIQATDSSGALVNLCAASGPIPVTVQLPVTK
jgi:hypothetical protein